MSSSHYSVTPMKIGAGLAAWSGFHDRFHHYRDATPIAEAIHQAATIPGLDGLDISRKRILDNFQEVKAALADTHLEVASVGAGLSSGTVKARGGFSAEDPEVRRLTVDRVKQSMDYAAELGTDKVCLWFGTDGYDYHFEVDFDTRWGRLVEGVCECARYRRDIRLCIEYKAREPMIHQLVHNAATALVLIDDVGEENVGVLFDVGHALVADEMLAEAAALLARRGKLWHVHLNDNYFHADSDLIPGVVHTMAFVELFFWLRRVGYEGYLCYDTVALTHEPRAVIEECVRYTQALVAAADRVDAARLEAVFTSGDAPAGLALAREALFGR
jgi:sugar phosphate isomerase/epimerase